MNPNSKRYRALVAGLAAEAHTDRLAVENVLAVLGHDDALLSELMGVCARPGLAPEPHREKALHCNEVGSKALWLWTPATKPIAYLPEPAEPDL